MIAEERFNCENESENAELEKGDDVFKMLILFTRE